MPIMDFLYTRALRPDAPRSGGGLAGFVNNMLYVRGHWLRMPPWLLVRHLTIKSLRRERGADAAAGSTH